jgi:acyl-CoA synthetase (AMP-forming)/AMP-acid ligase II
MEFNSLNEYLLSRAMATPDSIAYRFLRNPDDIAVAETITYAQLLQRVMRFSDVLRNGAGDQGRAVLLYNPGIDYIVAFFSCLWAGVVAVPAYPVRNNHHGHRLSAIVKDCDAALILAQDAEWGRINTFCADLFQEGSKVRLACEAGSQAAVREQAVNGEIAFLQYTSGSTGDPKGVMVSHANLMHNLAEIQDRLGNNEATVMVSWLPPYHDLGLISGILEAVYAGFTLTLMSPFDFIQRPMRWLRWISELRATVTGGPDFAFNLCVDHITPEQLQSLDLSCLKNMYSGAEPIQHDTLQRFCDKFAACGFKPEMLYPCYGLAEATLFVSGGLPVETPVLLEKGAQALTPWQPGSGLQGDVTVGRQLVGSGRNLRGQSILIVSPTAKNELGEGQEGEIWVAGPSVALGYWGREQVTNETFHAFTDDGRGPFLRTGDLGIMVRGELFVTGRIKDMIIIRGRKLYPHDIERAVEQSIAELRPSCGVAFQFGRVDTGLAFVAEIERSARKTDPIPVLHRIRRVIGDQFQLVPDSIVIVQPGKTFKTTSGKIQRSLARQELLAGNLDVWAEWQPKQPN